MNAKQLVNSANVAIIPARMASSRFPNKPLALIHGFPMVGHCYHRVKMSKSIDEVFIATCDEKIKDFGESIGAPVIMTKATHERASDRTAEAVANIESLHNIITNIVVMVQGDEPMVTPEMIDQSMQPLLQYKNLNITNLMCDINCIEHFEDPNEVKVVVDKFNNALYFSREAIPSRKKGCIEVKMKKQVCVIPFRREFLFNYLKLLPTPLEIYESIDMNRILENGYDVRMVNVDSITYSVDTEDDLKFVENKMITDVLMPKYLKSLS
jgi:3-deoxy-manno-octulosonate cytidylyltransferase (CMP-KDO synthetase)